MIFKNFILAALFVSQSLSMASTGWSGRETELDVIVQNKIIEMYNDKCGLQGMKAFVLNPIVSVERVDTAVDYLGSSAPQFNVSLGVFSKFERNFINQEFTVEVFYLQLSQEFKVVLAEDSNFQCVN
ncbi:hypothetical protein [Bacteriovorax sp. Seq25_V]|uniref:hypothetical protein n=1 Tax=Bacteriovorax sp. Seq25_V TaxID=1201288 RepID=UPI00038A4347|nr:hypothetical protein [Bacteriovorax sp. Seq25_V]EQC44884.1 hypothetical protein M900_A0126 [Bacteriovorax sp. Seq25_V]